MKRMKQILSILLAVMLVLSAAPMAFAADGNVAKVGNTEYATIDEAIAAWTNGTTLTLLSNVTLSDVIQLSSTEHHILDLGSYTMTAASKKDAIQIVNNGRSSASYALDIKADATNPGGITASGKAVVRTTGKSGVKDRPIIRFYNGVFTGSYVVYHSGSNGTNCPQFQFHGGEFNGTISTNRALNQFYGGTFTGSLMMSVDSSAYTLIAGGTFKNLSNLYMSELNSGKFTIGSAKGVYDKEVYVDDNGNYVIAAAEPAQGIEAAVAMTPGTNDYLAYSKVATEGVLKYTDATMALQKNNTSSARVTIYAEELDLAGIDYKGTIVVPEGKTLKITNAPEGLKVEGNVVISCPVAQIGTQGYESLQDAIDAAQDGETIKLINNILLDDINDVEARPAASNGNGKYCGFNYGNGAFFNVIDKDLTVDLNGYAITYDIHHDEWCNKRVVSIFYATDTSKLTIKDSSAAKTGAVTVYGMATAAYSVAVDTEVTIEGGTWTWNKCKTCEATNIFLYASHGGELYVTGGKFVNNVEGESGEYMFFSHYSSKETTENSAGVDYDQTKIAISGGTFENCNPGEIKYMDQGNGNEETVDTGCAEGKMPEKNEDGTYGVVDDPAYGMVAMIGDTYYETLAEAINAAQTGDIVVLLKDINIADIPVQLLNGTYNTYFLVEGKSITVDLNGKKISGEYTLDGMLVGVFSTDNNGHLTLTGNGTVNITASNEVYSLIANYEPGCSITIENGTYKLDKASDSLIYSGGDECVTVNDGYFYLGNVGTGSNGSPWIFNAKGQNTANIIVKGGTFNADIIHQYYPFEVMAPKERALKNNGDGTYTMVDAVAYVNEQEWSSAWYTNEVGYATLAEAIAAVEAVKSKNEQTSAEEFVTVISTLELTENVANENNRKIVGNIVLAAPEAALQAPENDDLSVTSGREGFVVIYEDGVYKLSVSTAKIGEDYFETLAAAIKAATPGDEIVFLKDINENVTISKNVTIDGADFKYTGTMTANAGFTVTVQNVNFVNGGFDKSTKSTTGNYTIKNCTFDGEGSFAYSFRFKGANTITIEDCTVKDYLYSFLYVTSSTNKVTVKNVTVEKCPSYAVYFASGVTTATFENLTVKNSNNGFVINNTANRAFTIKKCTMENVTTAINHSNGTNTITCTVLGVNDFGGAQISQYANCVLDKDATLAAPANLNVTTNVDEHKVVYENGVYSVVFNAVAEINNTQYSSVQKAINAAQTGDTVKLLKDINIADIPAQLIDNSYNTYFLVEGKSITVDMNGKTISGEYTLTTNTMLVGVFSTDNNGHLTLTGNGTIDITVADTSKVYSLIVNYEPDCSITIENGTYKLDRAHDCLIYSGCGVGENEGVTVNDGTFHLGNVGIGENGKPWIFNVLGAGDNFVYVTGGTFNYDINRQHWSSEVYVAKECYTVDNGNGTWTVNEGAEAYVNTGMTTGPYFAPKDIGYKTLAEALAAAEAYNDKEVTLVKDVTDTSVAVMVPAGVTLNLNGKYLTAKNILSFGDVIDSTEGEGGIKISNDTKKAFTILQPENTMLPIYDATNGCYRFFSYEVVNGNFKAGDVNSSGKFVEYENAEDVKRVRFGYWIKFNTLKAYEILKNSDNSGLELSISLQVDNGVVFNYVFDNKYIKQYANVVYEKVTDTEEPVSIDVAYEKAALTFTVNGITSHPIGTTITSSPTLSSITNVEMTVEEAMVYVK